MTLRYTIYACLLSFAVGAFLTQRYLSTTQIKTVETVRDVIHTQIQVVTHTVKLPSGEVDTTTTSTQNTQQAVTDNKQTTTPTQKNYLLGVSYGTSIHNLQPIYGGDLRYRLFGPVFVGGAANTTGYVGGTLSMEF